MLSSFIKKGLFLFFFVVAFPLAAEKLVIYHTSDIHGYYFPRPNKEEKHIGGFAVLEQVLRQEKTPFVLLDSGDFSSGNKEANLSDGRYSVELMNRAGNSSLNMSGQGYAALTIGNHDSDFGAETLAKTLSEFKGDILAANLENLPLKGKTTLPYKIYVWNGIRVAVIGYALDGPGMTGGMTVHSLHQTQWKTLLKEVHSHNPQAVILLAHDSVADARKPSQIIANLSPVLGENYQIDVFLGGHAHALKTQRYLGESGPLFVESASMLEGVNRIELDFDDETGKLKNTSARFIPLLLDVWGEEPETKAKLDEIEDKSLRAPYATVPVLLPKYPQGSDASPDLAKLMADQIKKWIFSQEKVDFAFFQLPGVRRDVLPGVLTGRDLAELLPYTEYISTFNIKGKQLKKAAEESIKCSPDGTNFSLFAYSSNIEIEYQCRPFKKETAKITNMKINGKKLSSRKIYRAAGLSHIPDGYFEGAPFKIKKNAQKKIYKKTSGEILFDIIKELPGEFYQDKQLLAPNDVRIKEKKI
ncbi:MAG: bifunctional metallophosphatase/5'-nucleotidase [Elusimicrobium sp.]|uniref:Bifunctional metallophosphatase/5'-nucleotidase n=1 Tax=Candidatus Avelusimicrobium gallicola TaxID=2562704 RepID=A0A928DQU9_9BACT|nr:bifunctional metallophosphatase/5'-nucleotidase [Elusimicrobium sp.]